MRRLGLLALLLAATACKRDSAAGRPPPEASGHETVADDDELGRLGRLDDGSLYDRAMRSGACSTLEGVPCADPYSAEVRCELAMRAASRRPLHDRLMADAKSADRERRGGALRVLTDFSDERSVHLVHEALADADPAVSCAAARYGIWFSQEDARRLAELEKTCDGKPVIALTRSAVEKAKPGQIVKGGVTCADIRAAR